MRARYLVGLLMVSVVAVSIGVAGLEARPPANQTTPSRVPPKESEPAQPRAVPRTPDDQRRAVPRTEASQPQRREPQAQRQQPQPRREPPQRVEVQPRYRTVPRAYYFPPVDVRLGFYYHPYFGFYYGPYYGPYYPYPGPHVGPVRYSASAIRTRVKPLETEIYLNGYFAGIVDDFDGIFQRLYVPAGEHVIELRLASHRSYMRKVYVAPGDTFELDHRMEPLRTGETSAPPPPPRSLPGEWTEQPLSAPGGQPASPYGILAIHVEPGDAQTFVDGQAWGAVQGLPELVIHLPAGWHQLEIRKEGYQAFSTRLEMSEGQTMRLNVTLTR
ncbi:MAG: PEGA domain-containing protein [Vicinamibacterales bacterium]